MALTKIDDRGLTTPIDLLNNEKIRFGNSTDLEVYHTGSHGYIDNSTGSLIIRTNVDADVGGDIFIKPHDDENGINIIHDGAVQLYYANSKKFETDASGVNIYGNTWMGDNSILAMGDGSDLQLKHDGANSYINDTSTGELYIQGDSFIGIRAYGTGENMAKFIKDGAVELYHDNFKSFATNSNGIFVYGQKLLTLIFNYTQTREMIMLTSGE